MLARIHARAAIDAGELVPDIVTRVKGAAHKEVRRVAIDKNISVEEAASQCGTVRRTVDRYTETPCEDIAHHYGEALVDLFHRDANMKLTAVEAHAALLGNEGNGSKWARAAERHWDKHPELHTDNVLDALARTGRLQRQERPSNLPHFWTPKQAVHACRMIMPRMVGLELEETAGYALQHILEVAEEIESDEYKNLFAMYRLRVDKGTAKDDEHPRTKSARAFRIEARLPSDADARVYDELRDVLVKAIAEWEKKRDANDNGSTLIVTLTAAMNSTRKP